MDLEQFLTWDGKMINTTFLLGRKSSTVSFLKIITRFSIRKVFSWTKTPRTLKMRKYIVTSPTYQRRRRPLGSSLRNLPVINGYNKVYLIFSENG
jgi:hypothetical protein